MSQIDKVNYIPVLFWFVILLLAFYFVIYTLTLPLLYSVKKIRETAYKHSADSFLTLKTSGFFLQAMSQARRLNRNAKTVII